MKPLRDAGYTHFKIGRAGDFVVQSWIKANFEIWTPDPKP